MCVRSHYYFFLSAYLHPPITRLQKGKHKFFFYFSGLKDFKVFVGVASSIFASDSKVLYGGSPQGHDWRRDAARSLTDHLRVRLRRKIDVCGCQGAPATLRQEKGSLPLICFKKRTFAAFVLESGKLSPAEYNSILGQTFLGGISGKGNKSLHLYFFFTFILLFLYLLNFHSPFVKEELWC